MFNNEESLVELLICIKCHRGLEITEGGQRSGVILYENIKNKIPKGVTATPIECLSNCNQGCSVALRGGKKRWSYIYGNLHEVSHIDLLIEGAMLYAETPDGLIPWKKRPDHFKKNCIARMPPLETLKEED